MKLAIMALFVVGCSTHELMPAKDYESQAVAAHELCEARLSEVMASRAMLERYIQATDSAQLQESHSEECKCSQPEGTDHE